MALKDLTGQQIQHTYQKVVQTDGTNQLADGTGSIFIPVSASYSISASHAVSASYAISASHAVSASYAISASHEITYELSSSYAESASMASNNFNVQGDITASGDLLASYVILSTPGIDIDGSSNGMAIGSSFRVGATLEIEGSVNVSGDIIANSGYFDANTLYLGGTSFSKNELDTLKEGRTINITTKDLGEGDTNKNNIVRPNAIMSPVDNSTYVKFNTAGRVGQFVGGHLYFDQNAVNDTISLGKTNSTQLTMTGNITASNNIRAIGDITASGFMGTINGGSW